MGPPRSGGCQAPPGPSRKARIRSEVGAGAERGVLPASSGVLLQMRPAVLLSVTQASPLLTQLYKNTNQPTSHQAVGAPLPCRSTQSAFLKMAQKGRPHSSPGPILEGGPPPPRAHAGAEPGSPTSEGQGVWG